MEYKSIYKSKIGNIILTSDGKYLTGLWFDTSRFKHLRVVDQEKVDDELDVFKITKCWLDKYFNEENPDPKCVPIKLNGSKFSKRVWEILKEIPYGTVITYGEIASIIGKEDNKKMSAQAVGHAVGHNPISIIVPCHRVVGKNGNLTGYGGGLDKKLGLFKVEKINEKDFFIPKRGNAL